MSNEVEAKAEESFMYRKLSLGRKLSFSLGFLGQQLFNGTQTAATAWFWLDIVGVGSLPYSIVMLVIYNIWNAVNDPIFGYLSDRTRTKWGRRKPWMVIFAPLWWIFFVLLYFPMLDGKWGLIIWFGVMIVLYDLCYTIVGNNYNALGAELTTITRERVMIQLFTNLFGLLGNAIGFLFPLLLRGNIIHFQIYVAVVGAVAVLLYGVPVFTTKERVIPPEEKVPMKFWESFKTCFKNKAFLAFIGCYLFKEMSASILMANIIFFNQYYFQSSSTWEMLMLVVLLGAAIPGFLLWSRIHKKVGTKKVMLMSTILYCLVFPFMSFINRSFEPVIFGISFTMEIQALILLGISGMCMAGSMQFPYVMLLKP